MKILGIDPGIYRVGFGIVEKNGNKFKIIESGVISPPKKLKYKEKLCYIAEKIEEVIKSADIEKIAIEEIYVAKNIRIALKIGQIIGIIEAIAIKNNFDFETIPPKEIKKCLTGIGSADKEQVKFMVETMTGYKNFKKLDESDAAAVAISSFYLGEENALLHKGKDS